MTEVVSYRCTDGVATIGMDDGKVNCINHRMLAALNGALARAEKDGAVVVLRGRESTFCAGFDLKVFQEGRAQGNALVEAGAEFLIRLLAFPLPIVAASTGHAIAMGSFVMLACDVRIGRDGSAKYGMNETAIGMTLPYFAAELARQRIASTHLHRVAVTAEMFTPAGAVEAGFLDRLASPDAFDVDVAELAGRLAGLNLPAYAGTKDRINGPIIASLHAAVERDRAAAR